MSLETDRCRSPLGRQNAQPKHKPRVSHGKIQKVFRDNNKNTYLIVVDKESPGVSQVMSNLTLDSVKSEMTSLHDTGRNLSDIIKRDLSNMDPDMEYDSGFSSTIFLENESPPEAVREDSGCNTNLGVAKGSELCIFPDFKPKIDNTPSVQTCHALAGTISQNRPLPATDFITSTSNMAYTTPTASVNFNKQAAARKIILVTPNSNLSKNITTPSCNMNSIPNLIRTSANGQTYLTSPQIRNVIASNQIGSRTPNEVFVHVIKTPPQLPASTPDSGHSQMNQIYRTSIKTEPPGYSEFGEPSHLSTPNMHQHAELDGGVKLLAPQTFTALRQGELYTPESAQIMPESPFSSPCRKDGLNNSLTNIQWLRGMKLKREHARVASNYNGRGTNMHHPHHWRSLSHAEIVQISEEYGITKRPPFSYMSLIQMALNSKEDKKMTLREICRWIEDAFKYYKHTAKPGWRNSIRHNLSLYNIFVRESSKRHGSYWTVKEDCWPREKSPKRFKDPPSSLPNTLSTMIPVISNFMPPSATTCATLGNITPANSSDKSNSKKQRKGPAHILPRPSPMSNCTAYALVPIQNLMHPATYPPSAAALTLSQHINTIVPAAQTPVDMPKAEKPKPLNIAPKPCQAMEAVNQMNIVQQAWFKAQNCESEDSESSPLVNPLSVKNIQKLTSGSKKLSVKPGLPKPTIYTPKQRQKHKKIQQKQSSNTTERNLNDSSDEESDFISKIECISTPLRECMDSGYHSKENISTSTPFKDMNVSPHLLSPIPGLSPFKNTNFLDGSFLDYLKDNDGKEIFVSPDVLACKKSSGLPRTPNASQWLDYNVIPFLLTPDKMEGIQTDDNIPGTSFSKLLNELPMEANILDDDILANEGSDNFTIGVRVQPS
ncbi:hypothetical protein ScPMuIL_015678 [Solemya velum]